MLDFFKTSNTRFVSSPPPARPFQNPSRKDLNVQMMLEIESSLLGAELIRTPCVYIRPEVDKATANKVKDIVGNHQGEICGTIPSLFNKE